MIITVSSSISMGHRLPSYDGICSSPHGHNVHVEVHLDTQNSFLDFKKVQDALKQVLEDLDHAMVLHVNDPLLQVLRSYNFRTVSLSMEPTTEVIASHIFNEMTMRQLYAVTEVVVHETEKYAARATVRDERVYRS